jgi:hypothetical protein
MGTWVVPKHGMDVVMMRKIPVPFRVIQSTVTLMTELSLLKITLHSFYIFPICTKLIPPCVVATQNHVTVGLNHKIY